MLWFFWLLLIIHSWHNPVYPHEKVPPGISPQHYQQSSLPHYEPDIHQMHRSQIPQVNMQHQIVQEQVNQQYQQQIPPIQQAPQMQQIPQQGPNIQNIPIQPSSGHDHVKILNAENIAHEKAHIKEHLDIPIDTNKMTEEELQFHYFKMHDADNNNKLDGCELIKSLIHWHEEGSKEPHRNVNEKIFNDDELQNLIDPILKMDDKNIDGYISYSEFIQAQKKAASATIQQ